MRVLVVSHNALSRTSNMGKTLLTYLQAFHPGEVAQFYIHSEVPTDDTVCVDYFRFTDQDALKSLLPFVQRGRCFGKKDIQTERASSRTDAGLTGSVYQMGRKRTAGIYALRNTLWRLSRWNTKRLRQWVREVKPDLIFFASGDYAFTYRIAAKLAKYSDAPLVVACVDDYYIYNKNQHSGLLGRWVYRSFMKTVHKTMEQAAMLFAICEPMQRAYEALFHKPCHVIHTPAELRTLPKEQYTGQLSYIGTLGYNRHLRLVELGRALKALALSNGPQVIDVYGREGRPEVLRLLSEENGIRYHGPISSEEVLQVMSRSAAVLHVESFEPEIVQRIRFSVSTKIAESLMYGPCLIAYGPKGVESMDYLQRTASAFVIHEGEPLDLRLKEILENADLREQITARARATAIANHSVEEIPKQIKALFEAASKK